ncbi:MAG: DNA translocase FtsK 4TM domain-containing protein, partial [Bacteroidota bacterium]
SDLQMANWLGRLGAIVSNMFFYWGFGLPSYILVYLLVALGINWIRRAPLKRYIAKIRYAVLGMVILSVLFSFLAGSAAQFPWGGAFGQSVSTWLQNFVGTAGMVVLFLFIIIAYVVWIFNPNFNENTFNEWIVEIREYVLSLFDGRRARQRMVKRKAVPEEEEVDELEGEIDADALLAAEQAWLAAELEDEASLELPEGGDGTSDEESDQLAFTLDDIPMQKKEKVVVNPENAELEIETELEEGIGPGPANNPNIDFLNRQENVDHTEPYDPTLELSSYEHPVLALLNDYSDSKVEIDRKELESNKDQIIETLLNYKIEIVKIRATVGPTITLYEIIPAPGVRISKIKNLEDDIALSLAALGIRIIAPIPGKGTIGIEVPNTKKQIVSMKEVLMSDKFKRAKMDLPIALGKTISNEVFVVDLAKMPHLLVAGATGQGKSVGINAILMSLLYKKHPSQVKLVMIDPKKVELFLYSNLEKHFLGILPGQEEPITTETNKVIHILNSLCIEMDNRYDLLKKAATRNIREYNEKFVKRRLNPNNGHRFLPFIVLVIDEFADLIMTAGKEVEMPIGRLAQLARAVGIHLIIATQRPSVNIITGVIKANFPARIAYKVSA